MDCRAFLSTTSTEPGDGLMSVDTGTRTILSVDSTVYPSSTSVQTQLSFNSISSGTCAPPAVITAYGAQPGNTVAPGWPANLPVGVIGQMTVTAADTVSVLLCNMAASASGTITGTFGGTVFSTSWMMMSLQQTTSTSTPTLPKYKLADQQLDRAPSGSNSGNIRITLSPDRSLSLARIVYQYDSAAGMASNGTQSSSKIDCTAGCSIDIPAAGSRPLYYQVERSNRENTHSRLSAVQTVVPVAQER
jgi:hypothetical protein